MITGGEELKDAWARLETTGTGGTHQSRVQEIANAIFTEWDRVNTGPLTQETAFSTLAEFIVGLEKRIAKIERLLKDE